MQKWAVIEAGEAALGPRLRARWEPRTLRAHSEPGRKKQVIRSERVILEGTAATLDAGRVRADPVAIGVEGWGLGDSYPDVVAFLCAQEPLVGGSDFLVDSVGLLTGLGATPQGRALRRAVWTSPVQLRTYPQYPPCTQTLGRRTRGGRMATAFVPTSLIPSADADGRLDEASRMALRWHELVRAAGAVAPRFELHRGEVLPVDNYRVFHGREGYTGDRVVHRGWFWTDNVFAYPVVTQADGDVN